MHSGHIIDYIEIKNFRCFDIVLVENLKRVNLISGDNNVGKSAFLEAVEIAVKATEPSNLVTAIFDTINRRQSYGLQFTEFDVIAYDQNVLQMKTNATTVALTIKPESPLSSSGDLFAAEQQEELDYDDNLIVSTEVNGQLQKVPYNKLVGVLRKRDYPFLRRNFISNESVNFIPSTSLDEKNLAILYGKIVDTGMIEEVNEFLRMFDSRIDSLVIRPTEMRSIFKIKLKHRNTPVLLSSMGGGLNRYIAIVCAIWKSKNGHLFIDELENGIHYSKYEQLWDIIFKTSNAANCQVFAATHSRECIEAFSKVAENSDHENLKYLNFSRTVDDPAKIVVTVLDSVDLGVHFQLGMDVR